MTQTGTNSLHQNRKDIQAFVLLVGGGLLGLLTAWWFSGFQWNFSAEVEQARAMGIVSKTILKGYPKSRDLLGFLLTMTLPFFGALSSWALLGRQASFGKNMLQAAPFSPTHSHYVAAVVTLAFLLFLSWNVTYIIAPAWNSTTGAWPLLGEQGATLAWVQSIRNGGVYGLDFFSLYGPMLVYPLDWLMDIFGPSALVERWYKWALDAVAAIILTGFLFRTIRIKWVASAVVVIAAMTSLNFPLAKTVNATWLRQVAGLVPILLVFLWIDSRRFIWVALAGAVLGQSLLFSQEVGLASCAALVTMMLAILWNERRNATPILKASGIMAVSLVASMAPMAGYLVSKGAGPAVLDSLVGYPRLVTLGFGALPFPSLREWLGPSFRDAWIHYSVLSVYVLTSIAIAVAWIKGVRSSRLHLYLGLLVFGTILFRVALGRSSWDQTVKVMPPALILMALWFDDLWPHLVNSKVSPLRRSLAAIGIIFLCINGGLGICFNAHVWNIVSFKFDEFLLNRNKFLPLETGVFLKDIPRAGVFLDPETATALSELKLFLDLKTRPGEYVYFFPNEAAYYFLLDRNNPTRYAVSYFACTRERQEEIIRDLEEKKPQYVVYSPYTWRVDNIRENIQVPWVTSYIGESYQLYAKLTQVDILKRRGF